MGKIKLARKRKYSHHKYCKKSQENTVGEMKQQQSSCDLPISYLYTLRNVPNAVLKDPSIHNYSQLFTILSDNGTLKSKWHLIKHSGLFLMISTFCLTSASSTPIPEKIVIVNIDFTWRLIFNKLSIGELQHNSPIHLDNAEKFLQLLDLVDNGMACPGIKADEKMKQLSIMGGRNGVFRDRQGNIKSRLIDDVIRPDSCKGITTSDTACQSCTSYKKTILTMLSNQNYSNKCQSDKNTKTQVDSHCPWKNLSHQEVNERITNCRVDRQKSRRKYEQLETRFKKELIALQDDDNNLVQTVFNEVKNSMSKDGAHDDFKTFFLKEQEKALLSNDARARRWHPLIIRWCFQLYSSSPQAYQFLKDTGVLVLPDKRTLRDYSNCFKTNLGFQSEYLDLIKKDFDQRCNPKEFDSWVGIIHDEVSIRKDLVFDDEGKLIGFVDLGSTQNCIDELEQLISSKDEALIVPEEATHMFVFMASSIFSNWKMPVVYFPTTTIKAFALYNVFWKYVEELELRGFKVLTSICDGASPHRKFYKFLRPPGVPRDTLVYKTANPYAIDDRSIYFVCDPVHLLKTTRNNWENSFWRNKTRKLRNNNMWVSWLHLIDAFENDINDSNASGLRLLPKLTCDHLFLNPYLRMRVYLAAQVFSNRVAAAITMQGKEGTEETAKFVKNMNDFFDCLNANKIYTQYEFRSVYRTPLDVRLYWLENDFLKYFQDWKNWAMNQTDVSLKERKKYFISDQTWEGLQICIHSFVELVKFSFTIPGVTYVVGTKFNQDPLEKFFGKLRQKRGAYGAFTCSEFCQSYASASFSGSHAIKTVRRMKRNGGALGLLDCNLQLPKQKK